MILNVVLLLEHLKVSLRKLLNRMFPLHTILKVSLSRNVFSRIEPFLPLGSLLAALVWFAPASAGAALATAAWQTSGWGIAAAISFATTVLVTLTTSCAEVIMVANENIFALVPGFAQFSEAHPIAAAAAAGPGQALFGLGVIVLTLQRFTA